MPSTGTHLKRLPSRRRWTQNAGLLAVLSVAALLRGLNLGRDSFWFDEAYSYLVASMSLSEIWRNVAQSAHPPLAYTQFHLYLMSGLPHSDALLRVSPALWNLSLVVVIYFLARQILQSQKAAIVAALLVAVSPFHLLYSQEFRMYGQVMTLVSLGVLAYTHIEKNASKRWWLIFSFSFLGALYTHYFALGPLIGLALYALFRHWGQPLLKQTLLACFGFILALAPWLGWVVWQATQLASTSLRPLTHDNVLNPVKPIITPTFLLFGHSNNLFYSAAALFLTLSGFIIFGLEYRKAWPTDGAKAVLLPLLAGLTTIGGPMLIYFVRPFFLPERTMAAASPFLIILLAWGFSRRGSPLPILVGASLVLMSLGGFSYHLGEPLKPPYRQVITFIQQNAQPQDTILHTSDGSYLPALRYGASGSHSLLPGDPDPRLTPPVYARFGTIFKSRTQVEQASGQLWLIVALEHSLAWQKMQMAHFEQYPLLEKHNFGGIQVYLFDLSAP